MDAREMDALVQRLVQNPHDQEAIMYAHRQGQADPRSYAMLLEKVGTATSDPMLASHWLTEAANVWITSLNDAHRAARALMIAIDRDPTQPAPAERLADLYREKGDTKALAALLERRAKSLGPLAQQDPNMRAHVASIHEELGRLWSEAPLTNLGKAIDNYKRAIDYDPSSIYAIYGLREAYKGTEQLREAVPLFAMEQALIEDNERKLALYQDEADVRKTLGDYDGAMATLRNARAIDAADPAMKQQLGSLVLDQIRAGSSVDEGYKEEAAGLFVELAEEYPGEHALAYSTCALEISRGHDRAIQLAIYYAEQLGRQEEVARHAASYLQANPDGVMADEARRVAGDAKPLSAPVASPQPRGGAAQRPGARPQAAPRQMASAQSVQGAATVPAVSAAEKTIDDMQAFEDSSAAGPEHASGMLARAQQLAAKNRKNEAAGVYMEVLKEDPSNPDALAFLQSFLRQTRKYAQLRDVLFTAASTPGGATEARLGYLREVAGLCETQLRDYNGAIQAWQQVVAVDPSDPQPREQLRRLLERAGRWDDLATLLEQEASQTPDLESRISIEKQLAKMHELKRKDPAAAGEAWARIASLTPDDDTAITTAVRFFEKGQRHELAAQVIADNVANVQDAAARGALYKKLGELREQRGDMPAAGEAYAEAAAAAQDAALWESAEKCFVEAQLWERAATAVSERSQLASKPSDKAKLLSVEAQYLTQAGDAEGAIVKLEQATEIAPDNDQYAGELEERLTAAERMEDLASFLLRRADKLPDKALRIVLRKRAAKLQRETLGNADAARESLELVLLDGDDAEALMALADSADERGEPREAVEYLARLAKVASNKKEAAAVALRQARLLAEGLDDTNAAIEQYELVLSELDKRNEDALRAIADLEEKRGNAQGTAAALERHLKIAKAPELQVELAGRLADLYEHQLDDPKNALRVLNIVVAADPDDFDAVQRIAQLAERLEEWPIVAEYLAKLIEVEGDEEEVSRMTRRRAEILKDNLNRGEEALNVLGQIADLGDRPCQTAFVELGDELNQKALVASKLVEWFREAPKGEERDDNLHAAFERFVEVGKDTEAADVAKELARLRAIRPEIADRLEQVSIRLKDLDALELAHELLVKELTGPARAEEMVRQAEIHVQAGVDPVEALQHGEQALTSVPPDEVEPLLERLAMLAQGPAQIMDLYERQVARCKAPADRLRALARAAQVAAEQGSLERARAFYDLALAGGVQDETIEMLAGMAGETDQARSDTSLRRTLAEALAAGGQGSRDGGRTRSALLRRAAVMISKELGDHDRAFEWVGDALVTHVDEAGLDTLEDLAASVGDLKRAEQVLARALAEVFDGPLVRKLLARRATLRAERLDDKRGAAEDLKRLHDLAPSDAEVMDKLSALYTDLQDFRGMVQLYEDQILRGRDPAGRAELARKVARLWEERLGDPREAADAWRRVLRMKSGDPEATAGLERAKSNMLKRPSPEGSIPPPAAPPEPTTEEAPPPPPEPPTEETAAAEPDTTTDAAGEGITDASNGRPVSEAPVSELPTTDSNSEPPPLPSSPPSDAPISGSEIPVSFSEPPLAPRSSAPPPPVRAGSSRPPARVSSMPPLPTSSTPPPPGFNLPRPPSRPAPAPPAPPGGKRPLPVPGGKRAPPPPPPPPGAMGARRFEERPSDATQVGPPPGMIDEDVVVDEEELIDD